MGVVVLARDEKLGQPVAIKLLPDDVVKDAEAIRDLRREVLRGMELTHQGIVRTHYFEQDEEGAGIVMEYVEGWSLKELKVPESNDCFDCDRILPWIEQLCAALHYAHTEAKIAHRDLKPGNVMVSKTGKLKLADVGISSSISDSLSRISLRHDSSGTPPYMSPQQVSGRKPSALDDIYSLGALIYELLTSKPPFFRGGPAAIYAQVCNIVPPSMTERREELGIGDKKPIPAVWEATIAACLAKESEDRPQSAMEIVTRLLAVNVGDSTVRVPLVEMPQTPKKTGVRRVVSFILIPVLVAGGTALYFARPNGAADTAKAEKMVEVIPTPAAPSSAPDVVPRSAENPMLTATKQQPYVNSLGMKFVPVPGTKVLICIHQTRQQDYAAFAAANPGTSGDNKKVAWKNPVYRGTESVGSDPADPVVMVSSKDADAFCAWLSLEAEKALKRPVTYRMPNREEWRAAWGSGIYPWGSQWPPPKGAGNYADDTARAKFGNTFPGIADYDDGFAALAPVGSFPANSAGLHDVGSNVQEWSSDVSAASGARRSVVGASWLSADKDIIAWKTDSAHEFALPEDSTSPFVGFRCVIVLPPE